MRVVVVKIRNIFIAGILLLSGGLARAESVFNAQAIDETKAAISQGNALHLGLLRQHVRTALKHAKASQEAEPNVHTEEAIYHLNAAIFAAGNNTVKYGAIHTQKALERLQMAAQPETNKP